MASESGKSAPPSCSWGHIIFQKGTGVTAEGTPGMCVPVCALGGKARWESACRENRLEGWGGVKGRGRKEVHLPELSSPLVPHT